MGVIKHVCIQVDVPKQPGKTQRWPGHCHPTQGKGMQTDAHASHTCHSQFSAQIFSVQFILHRRTRVNATVRSQSKVASEIVSNVRVLWRMYCAPLLEPRACLRTQVDSQDLFNALAWLVRPMVKHWHTRMLTSIGF